MTSVFISYAREDRTVASQLAKHLEARGFVVWWDRELLPGHSYSDIIEKELDRALAIVVLWSEHSRNSHWVRDEAAVGRDRNRLVPVQLDNRLPPLGFRQIHTVALRNWQGEENETLAEILDGLRQFNQKKVGLKGATAEQTEVPASRSTRRRTSSGTSRKRAITRRALSSKPSNVPVRSILNSERRQRSFLRTFWLTSFVVSGTLALAMGWLFGGTKGNAEHGSVVVAFGSFVYLGIGLIIGRFFVFVGRRLSKRKSVRYFDIPTIVCLGISSLLGLTALQGDIYESTEDAIFMVPLITAVVFPIVAFFSIVVGAVRGFGRTSFEDGR